MRTKVANLGTISVSPHFNTLGLFVMGRMARDTGIELCGWFTVMCFAAAMNAFDFGNDCEVVDWR